MVAAGQGEWRGDTLNDFSSKGPGAGLDSLQPCRGLNSSPCSRRSDTFAVRSAKITSSRRAFAVPADLAYGADALATHGSVTTALVLSHTLHRPPPVEP